MPHHGSKNNIAKDIISHISPDIAIFSHDNGLFGSSADPHPNQKVIDWCIYLNIEMKFTNDVIKGAKALHLAHTGAIKGRRVTII